MPRQETGITAIQPRRPCSLQPPGQHPPRPSIRTVHVREVRAAVVGLERPVPLTQLWGTLSLPCWDYRGANSPCPSSTRPCKQPRPALHLYKSPIDAPLRRPDHASRGRLSLDRRRHGIAGPRGLLPTHDRGVAVEDAGEHHAVADDLEREAGAACAHAAGNGTPAVVVLISLRRYARRAAADHRSDAYNLARPKPARHPGRVLGPQTRGRRS